MAKTKQDKKLYSKLRNRGVRKRTARELARIPSHVSGRGTAPRPLRRTLEALESAVSELKGHTRRGDRKAVARKAARTRKGAAGRRSAAAKKGARKRARSR